MKRITMKIIEIKGICPVYQVNDRIVIDEGYKLNLKESTAVCIHSLTSILPYYVALSKGVKPQELGLSRRNNSISHDRKAYVQCLDPCEYTGGGTVFFEITTS